MQASLSLEEARKIVLLAQQLPPPTRSGSAGLATLSVIEHLGYIQIDTISVIERAHHHTLWNRNPRYHANQLDQLMSERRVFEYWSHAAAYLPMRDYRFSLLRKNAFASGESSHWYTRDKRLMNSVLKRIENEGPLLARDFDNSGRKTREWESKPAKKALECLFMQGDLMTSGRVKFQKVYDLTERVLPVGTNTTVPTLDEYARFLICGFLRANGLGQAKEICYLLKNTKPLIEKNLADMTLSKELSQIKVAGEQYFALPATLDQLGKLRARSKLKILSPFDNFLIQRQRIKKLFDFNYQLECYVPKAKRQHGYFSLPILWRGLLAARMDCKVQRAQSTLNIYALQLEPTVAEPEAFCVALHKELKAFCRFNQCHHYQLFQTSPKDLTGVFASVDQQA